jgi:hypothetical protein
MRRAALGLVASLLLFAGASTASAQVFYMPLTYQYQSPNGGGYYYYGGIDPVVHIHANANSVVPGYGRTGGHAFHSGNYQVHREVSTEPVRIYSDAVSSLQNGRFYGMNVDDAANEAAANATLYFRKADLLRDNHIVQPDGTWVVPAYTLPRGSVSIRPYVGSSSVIITPLVADKPKTEPKPVLIIPKRLLDKPLWGTPNPLVRADQK